MNSGLLKRGAVCLIAGAVLGVGCGGGDDGATTVVPAETSEGPAASGTDAAGVTTTDVASGGSDSIEASAQYEPGEVAFRVVNALDRPVDLWVRTTGVVEAFPVLAALAPGDVSELAAPPADGRFIVTEQGSGDATCVVDCDHFIAELSATIEEGPVRTVLLSLDEIGAPSAFDLWEQPEASREGSANAMAAADPDAGMVVVTGVALTDADFGLRVSFDGQAGCVDNANLAGVLVGGNQTPAFVFPAGSVGISLHDNNDRECVEPPVGGPFTIEGSRGSRTHLFLTGTPGDMDGIVVPMVGSESPTDASGSDIDTASSDRTALAVELMAVEVGAELDLNDADATCLAEYIVAALGADILLDGDRLVELEALPPEQTAPAEAAIATAVDECGLDL